MAMMIFKNMGMPPEAFRIYRKKDLTIAAIAIPLTMDKIRARVQIADEIITRDRGHTGIPGKHHTDTEALRQPGRDDQRDRRRHLA